MAEVLGCGLGVCLRDPPVGMSVMGVARAHSECHGGVPRATRDARRSLTGMRQSRWPAVVDPLRLSASEMTIEGRMQVARTGHRVFRVERGTLD